MSANETHEYEIEEALKTWADAELPVIAELIERAEALIVATVDEFNADPTAAFSACQTEYSCAWKWLTDEDEPTIRVYDCDGNTIDKLT